MEDKRYTTSRRGAGVRGWLRCGARLLPQSRRADYQQAGAVILRSAREGLQT